MASDVSHPSHKLPISWKGRLSDQKPLKRSQKSRRTSSTAEDDTSPAGVVIEPTKPVTELGLPAFKIRQEIDRQPTTDHDDDAPVADRMTTRVIVALSLVAFVALGAAGLALFR